MCCPLEVKLFAMTNLGYSDCRANVCQSTESAVLSRFRLSTELRKRAKNLSKAEAIWLGVWVNVFVPIFVCWSVMQSTQSTLIGRAAMIYAWRTWKLIWKSSQNWKRTFEERQHQVFRERLSVFQCFLLFFPCQAEGLASFEA